jgi:hypothetical protein
MKNTGMLRFRIQAFCVAEFHISIFANTQDLQVTFYYLVSYDVILKCPEMERAS